MNCIFCQIIRGELPAERLYEDEHSLVFADKYPKAPIHLLYVPKFHIESLKHATPKHDPILTHMMLHLNKIASRTKGLESGYRTIVNTGAGGQQEVPHLHFHLLGGGPIQE